MASGSYDEILRRAQDELTQQEQLRLSETLAQHASRKNGGRHQITDLRGLGKEIWQGVNADEHVNRERESWDR
ncbi:MAG: hypothetical protein KDA63_07575 [Planctomycetales bacterium]|nr:hypothetical protein [Planctomycetales bacterium]